jgi:hypothetical protein
MADTARRCGTSGFAASRPSRDERQTHVYARAVRSADGSSRCETLRASWYRRRRMLHLLAAGHSFQDLSEDGENSPRITGTDSIDRLHIATRTHECGTPHTNAGGTMIRGEMATRPAARRSTLARGSRLLAHGSPPSRYSAPPTDRLLAPVAPSHKSHGFLRHNRTFLLIGTTSLAVGLWGCPTSCQVIIRLVNGFT